MLSPQLPMATSPSASPLPVFDVATNQYDTWEPTEEEYPLEYDTETFEERQAESKNTLWIPVATIGGLGITSALFFTVLLSILSLSLSHSYDILKP